MQQATQPTQQNAVPRDGNMLPSTHKVTASQQVKKFQTIIHVGSNPVGVRYTDEAELRRIETDLRNFHQAIYVEGKSFTEYVQSILGVE